MRQAAYCDFVKTVYVTQRSDICSQGWGGVGGDTEGCNVLNGRLLYMLWQSRPRLIDTCGGQKGGCSRDSGFSYQKSFEWIAADRGIRFLFQYALFKYIKLCIVLQYSISKVTMYI